jgi:2-dehydropantoate 2-reductase
MRIAVMGAGGVGGYYGGLLADAGHDVSFVARGAHLQAIQQTGRLQIKSIHGDLEISPIQATNNPAEIGLVDWVIVAVKTRDTDTAAHSILPLLGAETTVTTFQNGVDNADRIGAIAGMDHLLGAATWISSYVAAPGVIRQVSPFRRVALGEFSGDITPRLESIAGALQQVGVEVSVVQDIDRVLWTKFLFIAPISGLGAVTRVSMGDYRAIPETRAMLIQLMNEVANVAHASGIQLASDAVDSALALVDNVPEEMVPSMQRDVELARPSELESMIGILCRRGRALNVPTPVADFVYGALLPQEQRVLSASDRNRGI